MQVRFLGREDPLEEGMATHSSILAWRIPWTEELGRLWSTGSQRVGHDCRDLAHTHSNKGEPHFREIYRTEDTEEANKEF